jgi:hypothetical protein
VIALNGASENVVPSACLAEDRDLVSNIAAVGIRQIEDGPKPQRKKTAFADLAVKESHPERETGIEPATPFGFAQGRHSAWEAEGSILLPRRVR